MFGYRSSDRQVQTDLHPQLAQLERCFLCCFGCIEVFTLANFMCSVKHNY